MRSIFLSLCLVCTLLVLSGCDEKKKASQEVNLYSSQQEHLIRPLLEEFTAKTGIRVNLTTGDHASLVTRLEFEGEHTPADMLLTADIGNIYLSKEKGLLQPVESDFLLATIPAHLRDGNGYWYGMTARMRLIFYHKGRVPAGEAPARYEDLADEKWRGRLAIRSSANVYNQSLMASMVAHHGAEEALEWAKGVVANFARKPQGGDTDQIRALVSGEADIAVANSYYYGRLVASEDEATQDARVKDKVGVVFPNQDGRGAHVNIRGGGVTRHAKNPENAVKLLEYLLEEPSQQFFAAHNFEYPANLDIPPHSAIAVLGDPKQDSLNLEVIGQGQREAVELMDRAGWQ